MKISKKKKKNSRKNWREKLEGKSISKLSCLFIILIWCQDLIEKIFLVQNFGKVIKMDDYD
jgi:hypothetical protein